MNVLTRAALAATLAAAALGTAQPANAGVTRCADHYASPGYVHPEYFSDCLMADMLVCVVYFQPTTPPVQDNVVPQTLKLVLCVP